MTPTCSSIMEQLSTQSLETQNPFPDCVFMKLHSTPVYVEKPEEVLFLPLTAKVQTVITRQITLKLTIRFGRQIIKLPPLGQVCFGLKRGVLSLKLDNGRMPLETMGLVALFEWAVEVEQQRETGRQSEANIAMTPSLKTADVSKTSMTTKSKTYQILNSGTEEKPIWKFESQVSTEPILIGQLTEQVLGIIKVNDAPCNAEVSFGVQGQRDIHLFDSEGLFKAKDLSVNRTALLTREIYLRCIAPKLQPYLSQAKGSL